jgi:hypothetical protein
MGNEMDISRGGKGEKSMKIKTPSVIIAVLALVLGSSMAFALPFFPGSGTTAGTQWEDDDIDYHVDTNSNGLIDAGDVLIAPVEITKIIDILPPLSPTYNTNQAADELVALTTLLVIPNLGTDPAGRIRFGQSGTTPMVQFFTGGTNLDVTTDPTQAAATTATTDGTALWAFSITPDTDTEWFFDPLVAGANNPAAVKTIGAATKVGIANFALNQVSGPDIFAPQLITACVALFACAGDDLVDIVGSADILGGLGLANGAFARSDADLTVNTVVPEPSTLVLMGLGLLGVVGAKVARRRQS